MSRLARHRTCPECPQTPVLYHVTNRGVDRRALFRSALDYLVFLSMLALACCEDGLRLHAYCLMPNHFHLLIEDPRGMLSRCMLRLQTAYARYFNDSAGRRGSGHVFGDRFFCEHVDSARYYDQLVSYILLNPLRCHMPLSPDAESYLWSSARLHLSDRSSAAFAQELVERLGGVDALLDRMPTLRRAKHRRTRLQRFAALLAGQWIDAQAARFGRSAEQMRQVLSDRIAMRRPQPPLDPAQASTEASCMPASSQTNAHADECEAPARLGGGLVGRARDTIPQVTSRSTGIALKQAAEVISDVCGASLPETLPDRTPVLAYLLYRFSSATVRQIAQRLATTRDEVARAVQRMRALRHTTRAWESLLRAIEWRLRWQLRSAPWRP